MIFDKEGEFDRSKWHYLVKQCFEQILDEPQDLTFITPFGFEVFENPPPEVYLQKKLRRFYVYFKCSSLRPAKELEEAFLRVFQQEIKENFPEIAPKIAVLAARSGLHLVFRSNGHKTQEDDFLLVIENRNQPTSLLVDLLVYYLLSIDWLRQRQIPEMQRFKTRSMARQRVYQIFLILECIFKNVGIEFEENSEIKNYMLHYKGTLNFYFEAIDTPFTELDNEALQYILRTLDVVKKNPIFAGTLNQVEISSKAFHGDVYGAMKIDQSCFEAMKHFLQEQYKTFWEYQTT